MSNTCDDFKNYIKQLEDSNYLIRTEFFNKNIGQDITQKINHLVKLVSKKQAFSLIRLGDGEGNILFWGKYYNEYNYLANESIKKIFALMFGNKKFINTDYKKIYREILTAVFDSDIIGLPTYEQVNNIYKKVDSSVCEELDVRGFTGYLSILDILLSEKDILKKKIIVNSHIHIDIGKHIETILNNTTQLSVITCYPELLDLFVQKFDVKKGLNLNIPPQAVNIRKTPNQNHFPDVYNAIIKQIESADLRGMLFLVGAGILGKIYCSKIKKAGGMAIDVGSMMDVWMGESVRGYQNRDFVQQYKL